MMLKIPKTLPVKTRLPLAAWAVAGLVTLFSLMSSLMHAAHHATPSVEQAKANNGHVTASVIR
jgi:hypothetical protein